jgi:hypothetical protein
MGRYGMMYWVAKRQNSEGIPGHGRAALAWSAPASTDAGQHVGKKRTPVCVHLFATD